MDERTTSYVENGQRKTGVTRPTYNANTDYSALMQQAANAGDYNAAGYYEQQRNDKIAGTGSQYSPTDTYAAYYDRVDSGRAAALEGGYLTAAQQAAQGGYLNNGLDAIQNNYADQRAAVNASAEAQNQLLRQQADRQKEQQAAQYSKLGRQLYTDMMDERRLLPDQLAAQGYNGGATESSLLRNRLTYEQALRDNEAARIAGEKDIDFELTQGLSRQEIARQQAAMQLAGDYSSQYAAMMQNLQSQQNYEQEQKIAQERYDAEKALARQMQQMAYLQAAADNKAQYGDFSGYALITDLDGNRLYSDADIQQMLARWQYVQALAAATGSGGSGGGRKSSGSRRSSGSGSRSEDYAAILAGLQGNSQVANRYGTSQDGSRVTWILVNGGGRMTPEEVRRGVANGTISETKNKSGQLVYKKNKKKG